MFESHPDPTQESLWRPLRLLLASMDAEIARLYAESGLGDIKPIWVMELLRIHARGPMTITQVAESVQLTHSAVSQHVSAMVAAGLVTTKPGKDARQKKIELTTRALSLIDKMGAEWSATEAALAELESELPYPLTRVVKDIETALETRSYRDRLVDSLAGDPAWQS